ncbi:guanylate kinase [Clostridia bacterium]|nr:guanylate kinase [Clostridia bacterium]
MRGMLIIISGASGAGKGTIIKELLEHEKFSLSVSRTTRTPRVGEIDGIHYYFTSRAEFERLIDENAFFEYAEYNGNYYGTPIENVEKKLAEGTNVILEIEVQGALKIMDFYGNPFFSIFMLPPSLTELEKRLRERGTQAEDDILRRLKIAQSEVLYVDRYDYFVVNDTVEKAVFDILNIVNTERLRTKYCNALLQKGGFI